MPNAIEHLYTISHKTIQNEKKTEKPKLLENYICKMQSIRSDISWR